MSVVKKSMMGVVECINMCCAAFTVALIIAWSWRPSLVVTISSCILSFFSYIRNTLDASLNDDGYMAQTKVNGEEVVNAKDLDKLVSLLEEKDGGPPWQMMMELSKPNYTFKAWYREPQNEGVMYRTSTKFENISPEMVRDFFWDDDFRPNWDDMLIYHSILKECPITGTMICHWVKKFPLFCSNRQYIIARRIWRSGRTFFCVTKGLPYPGVQHHSKPKHVGLYYSSWWIREVKSNKVDGQNSCEVIFFHQEDVGITKEVMKFAVRQRMSSYVKRMCDGIYAYQKYRNSQPLLSRHTFMAAINTNVSTNLLTSQTIPSPLEETHGSPVHKQKGNRSRWIAGGATVIVCILAIGSLRRLKIIGRQN